MVPEDLIGQTLGHYKIKRQIGYGGMATVFLGEDIHLGREIALKVFWPRPGETQDFFRRFTREARVLAMLDHPNILPVYDYGEQGEVAFLITPYMAGGSLKEMLQKRKVLPPSEAIQLMRQVLPALQYAHDRNLIHRDIKPGNLLFKGDGSLVVADFGLVKVLEGDDREGVPLQTISETGQTLAGTPEYMSPEQINGHAVPASDIYSLAVVLYEMVTGTRPFFANNLLSILLKHANEAPRPPRELNPYISPQLESAILRALQKDPDKRFARPSDFQQALQQVSNPASNPGNTGLALSANAASNPAPTGGQAPKGAYGPTLNGPGAPTLANSQPGIDNAWPPAPTPIQRPISQPGTYLAPQPQAQPVFPPANQPLSQTMQAGQQAAQPMQSPQSWTPARTIAPPFVPQQPKGSRVPLAALLGLCVLLVGIIAALFITPLGSMLFGQHFSPPPTPSFAAGTSTGRGGHTSTPGITQSLTGTSTTCPANNTARPAITASLALGNDPTIAYIVDENDASGNPTYGTVKLFDTVNAQKTELAKTSQTRITEAQVSNDGQWVLFSALVAGRSELRLVRLDGEGLQTLLCAPSGLSIRYSQWSFDQRYVIFDEFPQNGEPTVYLLNIQNGALQVEVTPPASGGALIARTWLDYNRVLMVGLLPNSDASPSNIYILDIGNGANQRTANITPVFHSTQPCWDFDSSYDGQTLFIAQCTPDALTGSSIINKQAVTGSGTATVLNSATRAFSALRVIDATNTSLLAIAANTGTGNIGNQQNDGLYVVKTDGSNGIRLLTHTPVNATLGLNTFSQYFWSNLSRDNKMYTLATTKINGSSSEYILSFGQISGGAPSAFVDYTQYMAVAGWTTT
ncbi:MAG TPA: protein kinase [Ktedonobacteraceae bacterium]